MAINYFSAPAVAERYASARPNLNILFNTELRRHTGTLQIAADFGCGTGLSSRALAEVSSLVIGLDPSLAMLERAEPHPQVLYCAGVAESSPFSDLSFDLLSAALALHWFDRNLFLEEARRVLRPEGWLFVYNTWFSGVMRDRPEFSIWNREQYLTRYPIPPRAGEPIAGADGFVLHGNWNIESDVRMSPEELAHYLTTQSNVSAVIARGGESLEEATEWLLDAVSGLYSGPDERFPFGGSAWLLRRASA